MTLFGITLEIPVLWLSVCIRLKKNFLTAGGMHNG